MARTILLTGSTGAIGTELARQLLEASDVQLVLAVRDAQRGARLAARLPVDRVRVETLDVSRREAVLAFTRAWRGPLHVLVNNAAVAPVTREQTDEGLERVFATNVMAYLWLAEGLRGALADAGGRVVNVASYWAGDMDLLDLQFQRRRYDNNHAYRQSKQANRMLSRSYADRYAADGVAVYSCHPGDVNSRLSNDLGFGGSMSARDGARTPAWLATSTEVPGVSGDYFASCRNAACEFVSDRSGIERLTELCDAFL